MDNSIVLLFALLVGASIIIAIGISLTSALLYFSKKMAKKNDQTI
jgi:hypothetical protein